MSATVLSTNSVTGSTGTTSTAAITAPAVGSTLLVAVYAPTANLPTTAFTDNLGNSYTLDYSVAQGSNTLQVYRYTNIPNAPTSVSLTGTTGSFKGVFFVQSVANLQSSPFSKTISVDNGTSLATHTWNYTTNNAEDFVFAGIFTTNVRNLNSATGGFVIWPDLGGQGHGATNQNVATPGANSFTTTYSSATGAYMRAVAYKSVNTTPPTCSISDITCDTNSNAIVTVTLSKTWGSSLSVDFTTADDTAIAPEYYTSVSGTVTITAGDTTGTITVPILP